MAKFVHFHFRGSIRRASAKVSACHFPRAFFKKKRRKCDYAITFIHLYTVRTPVSVCRPPTSVDSEVVEAIRPFGSVMARRKEIFLVRSERPLRGYSRPHLKYYGGARSIRRQDLAAAEAKGKFVSLKTHFFFFFCSLCRVLLPQHLRL